MPVSFVSNRQFNWLLFQMSSPWHKPARSEQMSMVASAMAYMHLSAASATEKQYSCQTVPYWRLFSPSAFADLIGTFVVFARKQQQVQLVTVQQFFMFLCSAHVAFVKESGATRDSRRCHDVMYLKLYAVLTGIQKNSNRRHGCLSS